MQGIDAVPLVPTMSEPSAGSQQPRLKLHGKTKLTGHMVRPEQDTDADAPDQRAAPRAESFQGDLRTSYLVLTHMQQCAAMQLTTRITWRSCTWKAYS